MRNQHQPVQPPRNWKDEERRFAYAIDRLFDEVYRRIGELSERIDKGWGYELPTASDTTKGGVKIGDGLTMTEEVLSANVQSVNGQTGSVTVAVPTKVSELDNDSGFLSSVPDMTGSDGVTPGTNGLVPAPAATDNGKFLKGDGTWSTISGGSITTLWQNDSPSSRFAAQTVTLSEALSNYDFFQIVYCVANTSATNLALNAALTLPTDISSGGLSFIAGSNHGGYRSFTVSGSSISFDQADFNSVTSASRNDYIIPKKIVGIKL